MFHRVLISIDGVERHKVEFGAAYCFDWHCLWVLLFVGGVVVLVGECVTLLSAEIQIF